MCLLCIVVQIITGTPYHVIKACHLLECFCQLWTGTVIHVAECNIASLCKAGLEFISRKTMFTVKIELAKYTLVSPHLHITPPTALKAAVKLVGRVKYYVTETDTLWNFQSSH